MDKYKLYNSVRKQLHEKFPDEKIEKKKFSYNHLESLFNQYHLSEYCEEYFDGPHGEDNSFWYEVEGENHGWLFIKHKRKNRREALHKYVMKTLRSKYLKKHLQNRNIYYMENNRAVWYCIPLRDVKTYDIYIIFDKENTGW